MSKVIQVECPVCRSELWVDAENQSVVQHGKAKKKNTKTLDSLLEKEKKKKEKADERFLAARDLEREKKRRAESLFDQSIKKPKT